MKKIILIIILAAIGFNVNSQLAPHKYLVRFSDKNNSPYSISTPSQFLSAKALARRQNQGIAIKYNDLPVTPAYIDSVVNTGVTLLCKSKWFNSATIYTTDSAALAKIQTFPFVLGVDSIFKLSNTSQKYSEAQKNKFFPFELKSECDKSIGYNPSANANNKILNNYNYGFAYNQVSMIRADYLHENGYCGQGITIAVIDAGFQDADSLSVFDSLWQSNQILGYKDFVEPDNDVFRKHYHGTMVLSTIGGNRPGELIGTAPKASYWLLRSEDAYSENIIEEYNWASAAEFADSVGADVINSSLGYSVFDAPWMNHTYADMNGHTAPSSIAAATAASKGIIVCNSAGNYGTSLWHYISSPADADSILSVGAVNEMGNYALFSSTGPTSDGRIKPTVATQGQGTIVAAPSEYIISGSGTSFSSPILAGAVACLWQAFPDKTNMQIINAVMQSANQYYNPDSLLGYGIPNFEAAFLILTGIQIHNIDNDNIVNIFPNPFNNFINILFYSNDTEYVNIDLFDITGKKVFSETEFHKNAGCNLFSVKNILNLSEGIYILKISSKENVFTRKLMKTN